MNSLRLIQELVGSGLPLTGSVSIGWAGLQDEPGYTYHVRDGVVVRVQWSGIPTQQQRTQADAVVQGHDESPTFTEKLDGLTVPPRLVAALVRVVWCRSQVPPVAPPAWAVTLINQANAWVVNQGG